MGAKVNKLAISWKRLEQFKDQGLGINEVEHDAWKRAANRAVKKGASWNTLTKRRYTQECPRDGKYIEKEMGERITQAREDWLHKRTIFMSLKDQLFRNAQTDKEKNKIKREVSNLKKKNETEFSKAKEQTKEKITWQISTTV